MKVVRIRLFQYRNIVDLDITPGPQITIFSGLNGQGKTNILEAIYFLAYGRSFRTATPRECVKHGESCCRIEGFTEQGTLCRELAITISGKEKKLLLMGKPVPLNEFIGNLPVLAFTHEHLGVVRGGPGDRRAFLDRAMVFLYPSHVVNLASYSRALRQRNSILGEIRDGKAVYDSALLDSWDEAVTRPGARIIANRIRYAERMKQELPGGLFGEDELKMHYLSTVEDNAVDIAIIEEKLRKKLWSLREKDKATGYTSVGPHRDEMKLYVNGRSLVDFGSAGQQRSGLLSLYFSQMEIHYRTHGFYPVFLVDDAEAELDGDRLRTFLHYLSQRTQTILTSAKDSLITPLVGNRTHFEVKKGEVVRVA